MRIICSPQSNLNGTQDVGSKKRDGGEVCLTCPIMKGEKETSASSVAKMQYSVELLLDEPNRNWSIKAGPAIKDQIAKSRAFRDNARKVLLRHIVAGNDE